METISIGDLVLDADANAVGRVVEVGAIEFTVMREDETQVRVPLQVVERAEAGQVILTLTTPDIDALGVAPRTHA